MKKFLYFILLALPLFLRPPVYADTYSYEIDASVFSYFDEEFTIMKDYMESNVIHPYFIYRSGGHIYAKSSITGFFLDNSSNDLKLSVSQCIGSGCMNYSINNGIVESVNFTGLARNFSRSIISSGSLYYNNYLYSNFNLSTSNLSNTYNISYNDFHFTISSDSSSSVPTLYDIYQIINTSPSDNYPLLTTFYTTVSEKIILFANSLLDNYIYLFIFGIFILIFLIELIRRYLL